MGPDGATELLREQEAVQARRPVGPDDLELLLRDAGRNAEPVRPSGRAHGRDLSRRARLGLDPRRRRGCLRQRGQQPLAPLPAIRTADVETGRTLPCLARAWAYARTWVSAHVSTPNRRFCDPGALPGPFARRSSGSPSRRASAAAKAAVLPGWTEEAGPAICDRLSERPDVRHDDWQTSRHPLQDCGGDAFGPWRCGESNHVHARQLALHVIPLADEDHVLALDQPFDHDLSSHSGGVISRGWNTPRRPARGAYRHVRNELRRKRARVR